VTGPLSGPIEDPEAHTGHPELPFKSKNILPRALVYNWYQRFQFRRILR
jgi:hypothetical protein